MRNGTLAIEGSMQQACMPNVIIRASGAHDYPEHEDERKVEISTSCHCVALPAFSAGTEGASGRLNAESSTRIGLFSTTMAGSVGNNSVDAWARTGPEVGTTSTSIRARTKNNVAYTMRLPARSSSSSRLGRAAV